MIRCVLILHLPIPTDERIRATVVFQVGLPSGFENHPKAQLT